MKYLRFTLRLLASLLHVGLAALISPLLGNPGATGFSKFQAGLIQWLIRVQLRILGVRLQVHGKPCPDAPLLVSNHISWVDILVIGSLRASRFLSKAEVRKWFVIGNISAHFGTLFIQRGEGADTAYRMIADNLKHFTSTVIFPEGTTSDGTTVKRFYPRLFAAAIETNTLVQPVVLRYPNSDGKGINPLVPFIKDQSLFQHALGLLYSRRTDVIVRFTEPVAATGQSRDALSNQCHQRIVEASHPLSASNPSAAT